MKMLKVNNLAPTTLHFSSACTAEKGGHCVIKRKTLIAQSAEISKAGTIGKILHTLHTFRFRPKQVNQLHTLYEICATLSLYL